MVLKMSKSTLCCFLATALLSSFVVESMPIDNIFDSDTTQVISDSDEPEFSTRIVGGDDANENDYPYFVQMGGCGGSLVASDIVLFAAHCAGLDFNNQVAIGGSFVRLLKELFSSRMLQIKQRAESASMLVLSRLLFRS